MLCHASWDREFSDTRHLCVCARICECVVKHEQELAFPWLIFTLLRSAAKYKDIVTQLYPGSRLRPQRGGASRALLSARLRGAREDPPPNTKHCKGCSIVFSLWLMGLVCCHLAADRSHKSLPRNAGAGSGGLLHLLCICTQYKPPSVPIHGTVHPACHKPQTHAHNVAVFLTDFKPTG